MKARTWTLISVVCLLAALLFWHLGNRRLAERRPPAAPTNTVGQTASAGSPVRLLTRLSPRQLAQTPKRGATSPVPGSADRPGTAPLAGEPPHRLRNTPQSVRDLIRSDSALLLRNAFIDTAVGSALPVPDQLRADSEPGAFIIQARGPWTDGLRARVERVGATLVSYVPNNAFLVRAATAQAAVIGDWKEVRVVLPFEPYFKLDPALLDPALEQRPLSGQGWLLLTGYPGGREALLRVAANARLPVLGESACPFGPQIAVDGATAEDWLAVVRSADVQLVEPCAPRQTVNDLTRTGLGIATDTVVETNRFGLTGTNIWVNVNDTGIDKTHPDLKDRVFGDTPAVLVDTNGHGTHVAGIIASDGSHGPMGTNVQGSVDGASFRGMAPAAKLFAMGVDLVLGPLQSDAYLIETGAETNYLVLNRTNALISNNSWVYAGQFDYNTSAASFDAATRDALPGLSGSQPVLYVFGAGNNGGGNNVGQGGEPGSIQSPATAKNVITVGGLENLRQITNEVVVNVNGEDVTNQILYPLTDSRDQVAFFSGRGNVGIATEGEFGRFKPDVVAPGMFVVSTRTKDWDTNTPASRLQIATFTNQFIPAGGTNRYSITVPDDALQLVIQVLTNRLSPVPMPDLTINLYRDLAGTALEATAVNSLTLNSPDPGPWYYQIVNPSLREVRFDLRTRLQVPAADNGFFQVLADLDAALKGEDDSEPKYRFDFGTSMAAASISGMLALVEEFFADTLKRNASPALLKALLINGARSVSTEYNFNLRKTVNHQGWGLPTLPIILPEGLTNATDETQWPVRWIDQSPTNALTTGETHAYALSVPETARNGDLRVTLVWTDPPGNPAAATKLVNDLDLVVSNQVSGVVYAGNDIVANSDYNTEVGTNQVPVFDVVNNVENVFLRGPVDTNWVIQVFGRRINVNAVTAHTNGIAQDYALVVSTTSQTNALATFKPIAPAPAGPTNTLITLMTNGVPLLNQKVGANSPLLGYPIGTSNQWHFYVFTNTYTTNSVLTNGPYVAFLTFTPPNLSVPRNVEADIDLYVTRSADDGIAAASRLLSLDPAAVAGAYSSRTREGTEQVLFDDAADGEVFFIGVKAEDQMASEYSFIGISQKEPFETTDENGNLVMRGTVLPSAIPDGSPNNPGGVSIMAIGVSPIRVGRATVDLAVEHEQIGDLIGNLSHGTQFAVLNNHSRPEDPDQQLFEAVYDDSGSGDLPFSLPTDGPGSLRNFLGVRNTGPWILTMVDNALSQTGSVQNFTVRVRPHPDLLIGVYGSVLANQFNYYVFDVPADASKMTVILEEMSGPLNLYLRRGAPPTLTEYDKAAFLVPPSGSLSLGILDVPPLQAGLYYIGVYNPTAVTVDYFLRVVLERNLPGSFKGDYRSTRKVYLSDDARTNGVISVAEDRTITEVKVGLRVEHERVSDLDFRLVSPSGTRALIVEDRGGTNLARLGYERVITNFHHVALTYSTNSGQAALYLDGELLVTRDLGVFTPDTTTDLYLGDGPTNTAQPTSFRGLMDEVDLYGRALTPAEILAIYKYGGAGKPGAGLISRWPFDGTGADLQSNNVAEVIGPAYVAGRFGQALKFTLDEDRVRITNQSGLNVGAGGGFTVDAWVSPFDLAQTRTIAAWTDRSNQVGVVFGIQPGADTNALPGLLYASLPDVAGLSNRVIVAPEQGLLSTNWLQTNLVYTVLSDNTNIALLPIKFGQPAANDSSITNQLISGFEDVVAQKTAEFGAGDTFDGWTVVSNRVSVLQTPAAHTGTNLLVLRDGQIARDLPTVPGRAYRLLLAHRQQPSFGDMISWWPGEGTPDDLVGTNHGQVVGTVAYAPGMVGQAFQFAANGGLIDVPADPSLDLTNELTVELWIRADAHVPFGGGILGKREDQFAVPPYGANYGAGLSSLGPEIWYNDTNRTSTLSDPPAVGGYERLRLNSPLQPGTFYHLAGTYHQVSANQVELQIFLDGRLRATRILPGVLATTVNASSLLIGASIDTGLDGFNGLLDEVSLYRRVLTPEEIETIYLMDRVGKAVPPAAPRTQIVVNDGVTNTFTSDTIWATNAVVFLASTNRTHLALLSVAPGVMLDSVELVEVEANVFQPEESYAPLLGESSLGDWRIEVTDRRTGATNVIPPELISWQLELSYGPNLIDAVRLTNHVAYTNSIPFGAARYFYTDVPRNARFATNTLRSDGVAFLDLWFSQDGIPLFDPASGDFQLLTNTAEGIAVLSTNGYYQVDTNGISLFPPVRQPALLPGQRYYVAVTNRDFDSAFSLQVDFDAEDTEILGLTTLNYAETIVTNIAVTNALHYYRYVVSSNVASASFEVYPTNGNVNLYLRKAQPVLDPLPTPRVYDYASQNSGTNAEIIVVTQNSPVPLGSGPWYLGVLNADTNAVDYRIRVVETTNVVEQLVRLTNAVPVADSVPPGPPGSKYFWMQISNAPPSLQFDLTGLSGDAALYVQAGARPATNSFLRADSASATAPGKVIVRTNALLPSLDGDWYLAVVPAGSNPVTFTLTGTHPAPDPGIVALAYRVPVTATIAADTFGLPPFLDYYRFDVVDGLTEITLTVTPVDGDVDLVLRKDLPLPDLTSFDYAAATPGLAPEVIVVNTNSVPVPLGPGTWYAGVANQDLVSVTYTIVVTARGTEIVIRPDVSIQNGVLTFHWDAPCGLNFLVQYAIEIPASGPIVWIDAPIAPTCVGDEYTFTDDPAVTGSEAVKFFRILLLP